MDYFDRIQKSIDFMEEKLNQNITLDEIAGSAFFSKYYYSRLFASMTGKSPMEYYKTRKGDDENAVSGDFSSEGCF